MEATAGPRESGRQERHAPSAAALPSAGEPVLRTLTGELRTAGPVERRCYLLAAVLVLSGLFHLGVLIVTGGTWSGPLSWRKPATFGVSFGLTLATVTWVLSFAAVRPRARTTVLSVLAGACSVEVAVITTQAWRGLTSHFGVTGPGAGLVAGGAAAGAVALVVDLAVITVLVWRSAPVGSPSMRLALRAGFAALMVALLLGVYMLARGMMIARTVDPAAAFAFTATVKPGHAATMHGVLVLPALAWALALVRRSERFRVIVITVATSGYLLMALVVVAEALAGVDPLDLRAAPVLGTATGAVGILLLLAATVVTIRAVLQSRRSVPGNVVPAGR